MVYNVLVIIRPIGTTRATHRKTVILTLLVVYGPLLILGILATFIPGSVFSVFPVFYLQSDGMLGSEGNTACFIHTILVPGKQKKYLSVECLTCALTPPLFFYFFFIPVINIVCIAQVIAIGVRTPPKSPLPLPLVF
jgi:hypothetical protein